MKRLLPALVAGLRRACHGCSPAGPGAGAWPNKPVKLVAVFPPGGSVDQVARILGPAAAPRSSASRSSWTTTGCGASGSIGAAAVASSPPDGYTFGVVFDTHGVNPSLIPNLPFDTLKDLASVTLDRHLADGDRRARRAALQGLRRRARRGEGEARQRHLRLDRLGQPRATSRWRRSQTS